MAYAVSKLAILCPGCEGVLILHQEKADCETCGCKYPSTLGIPDLRTFDPPYAKRTEDMSRARELADRYDVLSYQGLLRYSSQYLHPELNLDYADKFVKDRFERPEINQRRWELVNRLIVQMGLQLSFGIGLDIGCGTGGFVEVMAEIFPFVVGVDIVMEELVLAHKFLIERGIRNFQLVCSDAEHLPFSPGSFSLINATDVVEHLADQELALRTLIGALSDEGLMCFNSPNRFDPILPEPHVHLRFVGFWPRILQQHYVRWKCGLDYKGKHLLSLRELRRMLRSSDNSSYTIIYWPRWNRTAPPRSILGRWLRRTPNLLVKMNRMWAHFVSVHEVIVCRPSPGHLPPNRPELAEIAV